MKGFLTKFLNFYCRYTRKILTTCQQDRNRLVLVGLVASQFVATSLSLTTC